MANVATDERPSVVALWRYPVKSMMGEELNAADMTERGVLGDRSHALIDVETGKVVSAKNPRKWGNMFEFRASILETPAEPSAPAPVRITLPDGSHVTSRQGDVNDRLSAATGRAVHLASTVPDGSTLEGYWPDHDFLAERDVVFDVATPPGTFFDVGYVHLLTTATLDKLRALAPTSRFETRRFRPNIVIETPAGTDGFVENTWVGRTLTIGADVRLHIERPCSRCVMTTLSQGDLPKDPGVLRAAVHNNDGNVGVYASVLRGGRITRRDSVTIE